MVGYYHNKSEREKRIEELRNLGFHNPERAYIRQTCNEAAEKVREHNLKIKSLLEKIAN